MEEKGRPWGAIVACVAAGCLAVGVTIGFFLERGPGKPSTAEERIASRSGERTRRVEDACNTINNQLELFGKPTYPRDRLVAELDRLSQGWESRAQGEAFPLHMYCVGLAGQVAKGETLEQAVDGHLRTMGALK